MKIKILASDIYYVQRKSEAYTADDPGNNNSEEQSKSEPDPDAEMESDPNMIAVKSNPVSDPSVQAFREEMIRAVLKAKKKERK